MTIPPEKLYKSAETLPAYTAPSTVRSATTINASIGEYIISAANEKTLARPGFAPGIISVGKRPSIKKVIRLKPVSRASTAVFFAANLLRCSFVVIPIQLYTKLSFK